MFKIKYGPKIDYQLCNSCGNCYADCPMDVFGWDREKKIPTIANPEDCRLCCYCEVLCPEIAIDVSFPVHVLLDFAVYP